MKTLIKWLMSIENLAAGLYSQAAEHFTDPSFTEFLQQSAEDERLHYKLMARAHQTVETIAPFPSDVAIDDEIKAPIEGFFQQTRKKLNGTSLSKEEMIDCIVAAEYSEWNNIFLYVVNTLKAIQPEFKTVAANIQRHLKQIERFLEADDYGREKIKRIRQLKPIWREKILVVEDNPVITQLLVTVLENEGTIDTAENGEAGLAKIQQHYYRAIISDVDMPLMDGITLFQKAQSIYPTIYNRYLFISGAPDQDTLDFFESNKLKFFLKPVSIFTLKKEVVKILHSDKES